MNDNTMKEAYRDFIQFSLNESRPIPKNCDKIDWQDFYKFCLYHSIPGVVLYGLEKANLRIPPSILYEWIGTVEFVKKQNALVNKGSVAVTKWWEEKGCRSVILKGQANSLMFPHPELRSPGDIDIWVDDTIINTIKTVLSQYPDAHYSLHHIKMPIFKDLSVEVHYRPIYLINWFHDKKLQKYVKSVEDLQFTHKEVLDGHTIGSLTDDFNVVYQLLHMYAHFFSTRNNFKQFVDYYYLLKRDIPENEKKAVVALMSELKILKYAQGMMWVMRYVLGLEEKFLIVEPSESVGKAILRESLHYGKFSSKKLVYVMQRFIANIRLARLFPSQVLISPLFLVWHQWWKLTTWWKLSKKI